jgi:hypothetical protein
MAGKELTNAGNPVPTGAADYARLYHAALRSRLTASR